MGKSFYKLSYGVGNPVWAKLSGVSAAILLILGSYADKNTKRCRLTQKKIGELTGIRSREAVAEGVRRLVSLGLITKWLEKWEGSKWRHTVYELKGKAICKKGETFLMISKKMVAGLKELTLSERKVYVPMAMRASINEAKKIDNDAGYKAFGKLTKEDVMCQSGLCLKTVKSALIGLENKNWIEVLDDGFMSDMTYAINIAKIE